MIPKQILIIGESNSVIKGGWVYGLSRFFGDSEIINLSIGSTGIYNAIRVLKGGGVEDYEGLKKDVDLLILDSFIQDSRFFDKDAILYKNLLRCVFESFDAEFKCPIAYLAFEQLGASESGEILKTVLIDECRRNEILFYDVKQFLKKHCEENELSLSDIYTDSAHPKIEIASSLGKDFALYLADGLDELNENAGKYSLPPANNCGYFGVLDCFAYYDCKNINHDENIEKKVIKNNLVDFDSFVLKSIHDKLTIRLDHTLFVPFGFFYNQGGSKGCFILKGKNELIKSISIDGCAGEAKLVWARPFNSLVQVDRDCVIEISLGFSKNKCEMELTQSGRVATEYDIKNSVLDLISVIFVDMPRLLGDDLAFWSLNKAVGLQNSLVAESLAKFNLIDDLYAHDWKVLNNIINSRLVNLALNCSALQSSYHSADLRNSSLGCNGVKNGRFSFHTALEVNPWWSVDLGRLSNINAIIIYNRTNAAKERVRFLRVLVSNNNDWSVIYSHNGKPPFGGVNTENSIPPLVLEFKNVRARYVKIDLEGKSYLHLDEVEIYGDIQ